MKLDHLQQREQRRTDEILNQFVRLAAATNDRPMPPQNPDVIAGLGLFSEVPVGNEAGYAEEELAIGGAYQENKS